MGAFDEAFLSVPQEVLTTSMKAHQKCFSVRKTGGDLANRFILIANIKAEDRGKAIIAGNDRVIAARLSDAKFFFDQDRKIMLPDRVPKLKEIVFHEKLGTQYERIQRVRHAGARDRARWSAPIPTSPSAPPSSPRPISSAVWSASSPSCKG